MTNEITGYENGCTLDQFEQRSQTFKPNGDGNTAAVNFLYPTKTFHNVESAINVSKF